MMYLCKGWKKCFNCFPSCLAQCANSSVSSAFSFFPNTAMNTSNHVVMVHVDSVNLPSDSFSLESEHAPLSSPGHHDSLLRDAGRLCEAQSSATVHDVIELPFLRGYGRAIVCLGPS